MIPIVYRYDDGNAPVLSGTIGSMVNLLTKCLVEGYGEKAAAGWTKEFANVEGTKAVFKNNPTTGNGVFLRVDDTVTTSTTCKGYEIMTDIDTGVGPFITSSGAYTAYKSNAANATSRPWCLVANDKFFYLLIRPNDSTFIATPYTTSFFCFGDFVKSTEEGYNSLIGFGRSVVQNYTGFGLLETPISSGGAGLSSSRALSGVPDVPNGLWASWGGPARWGITPTGKAYNGSNLILARPVIGDGLTANMRGWLPGLFIPCHTHNGYSVLQTVVDSASGRTFLCFKIDGTYAPGYYGDNINSSISVLFIEICDWDA